VDQTTIAKFNNFSNNQTKSRLRKNLFTIVTEKNTSDTSQEAPLGKMYTPKNNLQLTQTN